MVCFARDNHCETLAEALQIMLCEGRQHDMQRAAAFTKRLASLSLQFESAEVMTGKVPFLMILAGLCFHLHQNNLSHSVLSIFFKKIEFYQVASVRII
jgi:hypothetical protein